MALVSNTALEEVKQVLNIPLRFGRVDEPTCQGEIGRMPNGKLYCILIV